MENVIKTGYLKKGRQSNRFSLFRREPKRWFVFLVREGNQPFLEYYDNEESSVTSQPINSFDLSGCKQISYTLSNRKPSFTFCIELEDRAIELTALTRTDLIDWCDRLETSLHHYGHLEQLRGPDDEHIYTEAPFLLRRKKPSDSDDGVNSSYNDLAGENTDKQGDSEHVPGMVLVPAYNRTGRPLTIAVSPSEVVNFQSKPDEDAPRRRRSNELDSPVILSDVEIRYNNCENLQVYKQSTLSGDEVVETREKSTQDENRKPTRHRSIIVIEKDNSYKCSMSIKHVQATQDGIPHTIQNDMELINHRQSDIANVQSPANVIPNDSSGTEDSDAGEYETLVYVTDQPYNISHTIQATKKDENENESACNVDANNLVSFTSKMIIYENTESVNHKSPVLKPLTNSNSKFSFENVLLPSQRSGESSVINSSDDYQRQRTLSECLPDDEDVHKNVRDLLKMFEDEKSSHSGCSESSESYYGFYGTQGNVYSPNSDSLFSDYNVSTSRQNKRVSDLETSPTNTDLSRGACVNQNVLLQSYTNTSDSFPNDPKQNNFVLSSNVSNISSMDSNLDGKASGISSTMDGKLSEISSFLDGISSGISSTMDGKLSGISSPADGISSGISSTMDGKLAGISSPADGISSGISSAMDGKLSGLSSPADGISSGISSTMDSKLSGISSSVDGISSGIFSTMDGNLSGISSPADGISSGISSTMNGKLSGISSPLPLIPNRISTRGQSEINNNTPTSRTLDLNLSQGSSKLFDAPKCRTLDLNLAQGSSSVPVNSQNDNFPPLYDMVVSEVSPDLGYISDKALLESSERETLNPAPSVYLYDSLPLRLYKKADPDEAEGAECSEALQIPPALPVRRQRPQTMVRPHKQEDVIPGPPPRRSLSQVQHVSSMTVVQSVVPLKLSQAELLRQNVTSPMPTQVELRRKDCAGTIAFVNAYGCVWIAGWNLRASPKLHAHFHIGDKLISINNVSMSSASAAKKFIKQCSSENLVFEVKTAPKAKVIAITRSTRGHDLGLKRDAGTALIIYVDPNGLSGKNGLPGRAPTMDNNGTCSWIITEINSRPLNLFLKENEIQPMLNAVGMEISFVVQPSDFINELTKQLKQLKGYKDFLLW